MTNDDADQLLALLLLKDPYYSWEEEWEVLQGPNDTMKFTCSLYDHDEHPYTVAFFPDGPKIIKGLVCHEPK